MLRGRCGALPVVEERARRGSSEWWVAWESESE